MEVRTTLLPGQNGTKDLVRKYGEQLVCVRYRYNKVRQKKYKSVELIESETDWIPEEVIPKEKWVLLRIGYGEENLREKVKAAGGIGSRRTERGESVTARPWNSNWRNGSSKPQTPDWHIYKHSWQI